MNSQNKDIKNIDQKIREALMAEDEELFAEFGGEHNMIEKVIDSFHGKSRGFSIMAFAGMWFMTGISALTAYMFFQSESLHELIAYGGGFFFSLSAIGMMKVWYWMELNKNAITREIKRVELQLARLSARIPK
jgi:Family of unknown function (DUF6768)